MSGPIPLESLEIFPAHLEIQKEQFQYTPSWVLYCIDDDMFISPHKAIKLDGDFWCWRFCVLPVSVSHNWFNPILPFHLIPPLVEGKLYIWGTTNWLVVWNMNFIFSIYWECHHPNWRTYIFHWDGEKPPTRLGFPVDFFQRIHWFPIGTPTFTKMVAMAAMMRRSVRCLRHLAQKNRSGWMSITRPYKLQIPSGKRFQNYGKSPFVMGKYKWAIYGHFQ